MPQRSGSRAAVRGMTLLELLVALTIMAISVALIYRAVGGSARGVAKLEQTQGVAMLAESLMDAFPMVDPG
ncbi:type II secretion system protein, partial [Pseudomonas sp.]|uniref:type II secretion system protein n=2 Tax=Pseudomonadota TaxID=1224 RepID=UPI00257CB7EB